MQTKPVCSGDLAPVQLQQMSHGGEAGRRGCRMYSCRNCGRKDVDMCFRTPDSVAQQFVGFSLKSWSSKLRCPTCFSANVKR